MKGLNCNELHLRFTCMAYFHFIFYLEIYKYVHRTQAVHDIVFSSWEGGLCVFLWDLFSSAVILKFLSV